jgi:hypothetical protein
MEALKIYGTPNSYISNIAEAAALKLMDKEVLYDKLTLDENYYEKLKVVADDMRSRESRNVYTVINNIVKDYIGSEYKERYVFTSLRDTIKDSKDPLILGELKKLISDRLSEISH